MGHAIALDRHAGGREEETRMCRRELDEMDCSGGDSRSAAPSAGQCGGGVASVPSLLPLPIKSHKSPTFSSPLLASAAPHSVPRQTLPTHNDLELNSG